MAGSGIRPFMDIFVIYSSKDDHCWVAHSLRTDQIGTGDCVLEALMDGMKAVDQIVELAEKDGDVEVFCDAPEEIAVLAKSAQPLPQELYDIAHKKLYGEWPDKCGIKLDVPASETFTIGVPEKVCA